MTASLNPENKHIFTDSLQITNHSCLNHKAFYLYLQWICSIICKSNEGYKLQRDTIASHRLADRHYVKKKKKRIGTNHEVMAHS